MHEAHRVDHSPLINEISGVLARLYRQKELVVMAQPQMGRMPDVTIGKWQRPKDMKERMERLPDFQEQMDSNPEFRQTYGNVCAALDL